MELQAVYSEILKNSPKLKKIDDYYTYFKIMYGPIFFVSVPEIICDQIIDFELFRLLETDFEIPKINNPEQLFEEYMKNIFLMSDLHLKTRINLDGLAKAMQIIFNKFLVSGLISNETFAKNLHQIANAKLDLKIMEKSQAKPQMRA